MSAEDASTRTHHVAVTGAAGFIGSHLCETLLAQGHTVTGIDCFTDYYPRPDKERNLSTFRAHPNFTFHEVDLRTDDLVPVIAGADVVINEAATAGLVLSWDNFEKYQSCNFSAVKRLVDACIESDVGHFIQASTSSVYGTDATGNEDDATYPASPYGVTKLAAEHLLRAHSGSYGIPFTILRYFSIYGPRQRPDMAYRIFIERLLRGDSIVVFGDGKQSRSNTYVGDCVSATIAAMHRSPDGSTFNIGGGQELMLLDAIALISEILDVEPNIEFRDARRGDQRRTAANITRALDQLSWRPEITPDEGLRHEAAWVQSIAGQQTD